MIKALRILPPLAIGRFGSADTPMDNYSLADDPNKPLGYRRLTPEPTLIVDPATGEISDVRIPDSLSFREDGKIRPVAPFLEVFAELDSGELVALTPELIAQNLALGAMEWRARVANRKVYRRTGDPKDVVSAVTGWQSDHDAHELRGHCENFVDRDDAYVSFGHVRLIRPNARASEYRLRFMPPKGLIYGPDNRDPADSGDREPIYKTRSIYRHDASWYRFSNETVTDDPRPLPPDEPEMTRIFSETIPPSLYAIVPPAPSWLHNNRAVSRGYLDDACDGFIDVRIVRQDGPDLHASARICVGPPDIAPDAQFLRCLSDDLEQVIHGPVVAADEDPAQTRARALDIVRRAFETVRFMNLEVANGNDFKGRSALTLDSMPQEESADLERALRPVVPPETADTMAITALHEQVYAALQGGAAPWFEALLRQPEEVTDFTDDGRRKMPAMMCGADNAYLALTRRQIATISATAAQGPMPDPPQLAPAPPGLVPRNRTARAKAAELTRQLNYEARGNPVSSRPISSVANCCPGLEMDFRAAWRRMFDGIELREYDNLITGCRMATLPEGIPDLTGHRLLQVELPSGEAFGFTAQLTGPAPSDPKNKILLTTTKNPHGLAALEWSNALAPILAAHQGQQVIGCFSPEVTDHHVPYDRDTALRIPLTVRHFFDSDTALISEALAEAGELTQGLCSPWQNDYRECSCYYWASARPDYVNVEPGTNGLSAGDNWLQKSRTGSYVPDDYEDSRLILYDDLFLEWEQLLRFQIGGHDAPGEDTRKARIGDSRRS